MENKQSCSVWIERYFLLSETLKWHHSVLYYDPSKTQWNIIERRTKKIPDSKTNKREKEPRINSSSSRIPKSKYSKRIGGRNRKDPVEYIYINVCVFFFRLLLLLFSVRLADCKQNSYFFELVMVKRKFFRILRPRYICRLTTNKSPLFFPLHFWFDGTKQIYPIYKCQ